jgi:hypothetical protein
MVDVNRPNGGHQYGYTKDRWDASEISSDQNEYFVRGHLGRLGRRYPHLLDWLRGLSTLMCF